MSSDLVVASLERWGKRDGMGQQLFANTASLEAQDDKTVEIGRASCRERV